jgi:hypothetical protein
MWVPRRLRNLCASRACYRDSFVFFTYYEFWNGRKSKEKWTSAVEIDSREILKERDWKKDNVGREIWRSRLKETNAE